MKTLATAIFLLCAATLFGQAENKELTKLLKDIFEDSAFNADIASINGVPLELSYVYGSDKQRDIALNPAFRQKGFTTDDQHPWVTVTRYKTISGKYQKTARLRLILADGTSASISATLFSPNRPWYPHAYHLHGKNLETRRKVRIIRFEI